MSLRALSRRDLALLLQESGSKLVTHQLVAEDVDAGMPTNADGTFDLIAVAAWQVLKLK